MGVPSAIAEGVELLDIAELQRRLLLDPGPKTHLEGAVEDGIERAERQAVRLAGADLRRDHQDQRLLVLDRDDRRVKPDLDWWSRGGRHPARPRCLVLEGNGEG